MITIEEVDSEASIECGQPPFCEMDALRSVIREELATALGQFETGMNGSFHNLLDQKLYLHSELMEGSLQNLLDQKLLLNSELMQCSLQNWLDEKLLQGQKPVSSTVTPMKVASALTPGKVASAGTPGWSPPPSGKDTLRGTAGANRTPLAAPACRVVVETSGDVCLNACPTSEQKSRLKLCAASPDFGSASGQKASLKLYGSPGDSLGSTPTDQPARQKSKKKVSKGTTLFQDKEDMTMTRLQRLTAHRYYEAVSGVVIVLNSIFIGWQAQYLAEMFRARALRNEPLGEPPGALFIIHVLFSAFFTLELSLRWSAEGLLEFFKTGDLGWNLLDVTVVFTSLLELLLDVVSSVVGTQQSEVLQNISVIRVLRVARIVRVARVIRTMKFFRELRMMIYSILGSAKNMMWVMVVLVMTFYLFSISFTTGTTDFMDTPEKWTDPEYADLVDSFGTIDRSMLSLFMSMSGGNDWGAYYEALLVLPLPYRYGFLLFIAFAIFAVVNIVTGVFVESALGANLKDKHVIVQEELHQKKTFLQAMKEIFEEMDSEGKGTIALEEFEDKLNDHRVMAYFRGLKLDISDARMLFHLLDYDHSNEIGIEEFLDGCYKLQGESRTLDMKIMQYELKYLEESFGGFDRKLDHLTEHLDVQAARSAQFMVGNSPYGAGRGGA